MHMIKLCRAFSAFIFMVTACMVPYANAAQVQLAWDAPTTNTDGTPVKDLAGYKLYYGPASRKYTATVDVGKVTSFALSSLAEGQTYYFTVTAYNLSKNESGFSNEVSTTISLPDKDTDGDGLFDRDEIDRYGTDPHLADTDGDGLEDGDEVTLWGNDWDADFDGDGLINLLDPDADGDGLEDGEDDDVLLPVQTVTASAGQAPNVATNTLDGNVNTRWSAEGAGQWLRYDLGAQRTVSRVAIAWYLGNQRRSTFALQVSLNGTAWTEVYRGSSSGTTLALETYAFTAVPARYVRIVGYGNTTSQWNSITEVEIYGRDESTMPVQTVTASAGQAPNVATNTLDGNVNTRWSAEGAGQWLRYDLGAQRTVSRVAIAWYLGNQRRSTFALQVSLNGTAWTEVYRGSSSGTTLALETYAFTAVPARYVRIVGYGSTTSQWNSITEVEL